jgi:hypothetical protein
VVNTIKEYHEQMLGTPEMGPSKLLEKIKD